VPVLSACFGQQLLADILDGEAKQMNKTNLAIISNSSHDDSHPVALKW
jgi:GMP synthase-like glutamine amidotransferase